MQTRPLTSPSFSEVDGELVGYSDADYARCTDTSRSTSGYVFMTRRSQRYPGSHNVRNPQLCRPPKLNTWRSRSALRKLSGYMVNFSSCQQQSQQLVLIHEDNQAAIKLLEGLGRIQQPSQNVGIHRVLGRCITIHRGLDTSHQSFRELQKGPEGSGLLTNGSMIARSVSTVRTLTRGPA